MTILARARGVLGPQKLNEFIWRLRLPTRDRRCMYMHMYMCMYSCISLSRPFCMKLANVSKKFRAVSRPSRHSRPSRACTFACAKCVLLSSGHLIIITVRHHKRLNLERAERDRATHRTLRVKPRAGHAPSVRPCAAAFRRPPSVDLPY